MRVLHLIERYLPPSQVWLYLLLQKTQQDIQHHIGTRRILSRDFHSPQFRVQEAQRGAYRLALKAISGDRPQRYWQHLLLLLQNGTKPTEAQEWLAYIQEHEIDLIHLHFGPHACEHLDWLRTNSIPFLVSFYGYDYEKAPYQKPRLREAYRALFEQAQAVICEGEHGQQILAEHYDCPREKLFVVPLGIELADWPTPEPTIKEVGQLRLLQVADFTPKKGQLDTITAAQKAKQLVPKLTLTLVGQARDQAYYQSCRRLIQQLNAEAWIKVQQFVPLSELRELMGQHDAFIHPSRYTDQRDCEGGAPTIVFYAQCLGLPVISTHHCDIPGVVKDGISGILVREGDQSSLSEAIQTMANCSPEEWLKWQEQTSKWGREVADLNRGAKALTALYAQLAKQKPQQ